MTKLIDYYHKYPHYILYWVVCKSKYASLEEWAKDNEDLALDRGAIESVIAAALKFYKTYQIK